MAPDVELEDNPKSIAVGHDPQLEKAVAIVMEELRKNPQKQFAVPPYPDYHKGDALGIEIHTNGRGW